MSRAIEIFSREFDSIYFNLSPSIRGLIDAKIDDVGSRLGGYPHHRLKGRPEYRLRAGDYRIIYELDQQKNILYLLTLGHRREIYR